jgi:hypothetical protein
MKRPFLVTISFAGMIAMSFAFTKNEPRYKNLKILPQNITEHQMDSVMHHFTASLNVTCNFCHVKQKGNEQQDFASDNNKHKKIAREMMVMTDSINLKYFDFTGAKIDLNTQLVVTCFTCHHGSSEPATKASVQQKTWQIFGADSVKRKQ